MLWYCKGIVEYVFCRTIMLINAISFLVKASKGHLNCSPQGSNVMYVWLCDTATEIVASKRFKQFSS